MASTSSDFGRRVALASAIVTAFVVGALALWHLVDVWLLAFGGVLFAVGLRGLGELGATRTSLDPDLCTGIACALVFALGLGGIVALGPQFAEGLDGLRETLPEGLQGLEDFAGRYPWLGEFVAKAPEALSGDDVGAGLAGRVGDFMARAAGVVSGLLGALVGAFVIVIVAVYAALSPELYAGALGAVLPKDRRERLRTVLGDLATSLRWWLVGRLASMAVVGLLSGVGLALLGVPSPITLGVLAALLSFVPNVGPVLSLVPAALAGLTVGPTTALYVVVLYLAVQTVESYLVTPLIQQRAVTLPPAIVIVVQLAFGAAFGLLGLLFATPLAVVAMVLVQRLWIEDVLGRDPDAKGPARAAR